MTIEPDRCRDAVIVLPGIMGSELVDTATGNVLWGLTNPGWYVSAWGRGESLRALAVTEDERAGRVGRVRATRTLRVPAFAPMFRGIEPYTDLVATVKRFAADTDAVKEFAYDWRLAIDHNAGLLARLVDEHLTAWRKHRKGSSEAGLVLIAHSMGGLIARFFADVLGGARDVRDIVTLGTPFYGAAKAIVMLSTGRGAPLPLPRRRLCQLARTMPGLHDLLPTYRCVDAGASARHLEAADIDALGGDGELARQAFARRARLHAKQLTKQHSVVGVQQATIQSVSIADGVAEPLFYTCLDAGQGGLHRVDRRGDSTVYRDAAAPQAAQPAYLPQSHSALARSEEAIAHVCAIMTGRNLGPPLGEGGVGLELPDVVHVGESFEVTGSSLADLATMKCDVERIDATHTASIDRLHLLRRGVDEARSDVTFVARTVLTKPGMYRFKIKHGASSAVSQIILAVDPGTASDGDIFSQE